MPAIADLAIEDALRSNGCSLLAGVDEVGRGCWAGPVYAAAVVLPDRCYGDRSLLAGVTDSKLLSPAQRETLDREIRALATAVGVGSVGAPTIDQIGIVPASRLAMRLALEQVTGMIQPDHVLIDSLRLPDVRLPQSPLVKGDRRCLCIAAASIVAKVARDADMAHRALGYPQYRFERNRGYGTLYHRRALLRYGLTPLHRRSFAPMKLLIGRHDHVAGLLPNVQCH